MQWVGLQCVTVVFPDHTHLLLILQMTHLVEDGSHGINCLRHDKKVSTAVVIGILRVIYNFPKHQTESN